MSDYTQDLRFNLIVPQTSVTSPKQAYMALTQAVSQHINIAEFDLFERLIDRDALTSCTIGDGIAMPHLKIRGLKTPFVALMTLNKKLDFKAIDEIPVDMICLVMSPEREGPLHLRRLSRISRVLKNNDLHKKLCEAKDEDVMRSILMNPEGWLLAA